MQSQYNQSMINQSNLERDDFLQKLKKFPPFYTIQDHEETRKKQLMYWSQIVHYYFKENQIQISSLSELSAPEFGLFQDLSTGVPKKLSKEEIKLILDEMFKLGNIKWEGNTQENFTVNWFSSFELADCIYLWAKKCHFSNKMESVQYIIDGQMTEPTEKFYKLPQDQIMQALYVLEQNQKGEVKIIAGSNYFKFF